MKKLLLSFATAVAMSLSAHAEVIPDAPVITVSEFLRLADTETVYQLTGTVSNIIDTQYGDFDLVDETGSIYIYGLLNADGQSKKFSSMGIEEGDILTLQGKYTEYNGNPEIKNAQFVSLVKGEGGNPDPEPDLTPDTPVNGSYFVNGGFEDWTNDAPDHWKSASTASNGTLLQSTDAHQGSYSVIIEGADKNKRLAYKELVLAAGTYTFSFYAKADAGNEAAEVRPGYAPWLADGTLGNYVYGEYVKVENDDEWQLVQHVFTLSEVTKLNVVVMNPKNCGNVMLDDALLEEGDKTNAIRSIVKDKASAINPLTDVVYNICGKRVYDISRKGVYVVNGKKYVVR